MRALVLAAGHGKRLRPLTLTTPKALVRIAGRPVIEYTLGLLRRSGITEVAVNLHHLGGQIRQALGSGAQLGVKIKYSDEDPLLDTGGAVKKLASWLGTGTFVVVNADTIMDLGLAAVLHAHRETGAIATMVVRADPMAERYGLVEIDRSNRVRRFLGQPAETITGLDARMFAGLQVLDPRVFAYMPRLEPFGITRQTYPAMLSAGEPVFGFPFDGFWATVDRPEDIARAEAYFASRGGPAFFSDRPDQG